MRLGQVVNPEAARWGKPLDGIRVLSLEQMQALPYATQLLGRLGAEVVKVEAPGTGDLGRSAAPAMADPAGRPVGATFVRNNLSKRSVVIDLKHPAGRDLVLRLAPRFDVVAENFRAGAAERLGLAFDDVVAAHPSVVYLSISGFGRPVHADVPLSPYDGWPALASIVEAMSGAYEFKRPAGQAPVGSPMGGLGDIATALFAVIGTLSALRQRDRTGEASVSTSPCSMPWSPCSTSCPTSGPWACRWGPRGPASCTGSAPPTAGSCSRCCGRTSGPTWPGRSTGPSGPTTRASRRPRAGSTTSIRRSGPPSSPGPPRGIGATACDALNAAGLVAGPVATDADVVADPHLAARHMLVEHPRSDGVAQPVLIPGLPVKFAEVAEGPETARTVAGRAHRRGPLGRAGTGAATSWCGSAPTAPSPDAVRSHYARGRATNTTTAAKSAAPTSVQAWKTSWKPNTRGQGSGRLPA